MIVLSRRERMTLAVTAAVLLTLPAVHPVYADGDWALRCVGGVLAVSVVTFLSRVVGLPALLQPLLGLAALLYYSCVVFAGSTLAAGVPTGDTFRRMDALISAGSDAIATLAAPVPTADGLVLLGVLATGAVAVVVDAVAVLARRAALAGVPLLVLFVAPAALAQGAAGWWAFALAGLGWLLLLLADGTERVHRWGVAVSAPGHRAKPGGGLGYAGSRIAVLAVGTALALPLVLPDVGDASGRTDDDGPRTISTYNPLTKLRGELSLPRPRTILTYTTTDPEPDYLRMTTLEVYDGDGWRQSTLNGRLDEDGVEDRTLPSPVGLDERTSTESVTATIDIGTLDAYWLPAPATPSEVDVEGPWLWDERSDSVFATRTNTTEIAPYTVTSTRTQPAATQLREAPGAVPEQIRPFSERPQATPFVRRETNRVTAGATTAYAKAQALQEYFRGPDFSYSLQTTNGGSPDALEDFLQQKRGFCEQYASAMAAMLRLSGVPSRVAVGFTPGSRRADGSRVVTTEQAHAWPEAWISGAGWVRFEPTPGQGFAPPYTRDPGPAARPSTSPSPSAAPTPTTGPGAPAVPSVRPDAEDRALAPAASGDDRGSGFPTGPALGVLLLLAVLAVPGSTHVLRRRARWQTGGAGAAWAQLRDDTEDVGLPLDPSRSPRQVLDGLARQAALEGEDRQALGRLALAVERDRYAPPGASEPTGLQADTEVVRRALHAPLSRRQRLRLLALPPSTLRWARAGVSGRARRAVEGLAGASAGLGARLRRS